MRSAPSSYDNSLEVVNWKGEEALTVNEVAVQLWQNEESISFSLVSAMEKLSQKVQRLEESMSLLPTCMGHHLSCQGQAFLCSGERIQRLHTMGHPVVLPA